jgi:hypothetical protein
MSDHAKERQIPIILVALGFTLYVLAAFVHTGSQGVGPTLVVVLVGGAVQTAILIGAALLVGTLLSVSFGSVSSAALKFAGAALASGGLAAVIPFGGIVALFVFLGLIMWLFELELTYAVVLTVVYFVISYAVGLVLRAALA